VTENQKYIDEVTVIDSNNDQVIIDLAHVARATNENQVYQHEGNNEPF